MSFDPVDVVMTKLQALAGEKGDGQFTIRVSAKRGMSVVPTTLATFNEGALGHLGNIESWLSRLVGGGEYMIVVNHATDLGKRFPFVIGLPGAPLSAVNTSVISAVDWSGPTNLVQTTSEEARTFAAFQQPQQQVYNATPVVPAQVFNPRFVPQPVQQPVMQQGIPVTPAGAQALGQMSTSSADSLLIVQRAEAAAREQISAKEMALDRRETEERMRREAQDREQKLRNEMNAQLEGIKAALASKPAEKAGPDVMTIVTAISAALGPVMSAFIASSNDAKRQQIEAGQKQAEMMMKMQADAAAMQQRMSEQQTTMMMKMMERPAQSPEMAAMLDLTRAQAESQGAMMGQIVNAMGTVSKMSIGMIETIADMTAPPEGSPVMDAVKDTVKALGSLMQGADTGARKSIVASQQAIPAKAQIQPTGPTPEQLAAARARAAQVNQQAQAQQAAHAASVAGLLVQQPAPAPTQANVVQFPTPAPQAAQPELRVGTPVAEQRAFGDVEMPDGFAGVETKSAVDELEGLVRALHQPVDAVAQFMIDSLATPEFRGALQKVGGDPSALMVDRLGLPWIMANQSYVEALGASLERLGTEQGVFETEEEDAAADIEPATVEAHATVNGAARKTQ